MTVYNHNAQLNTYKKYVKAVRDLVSITDSNISGRDGQEMSKVIR